MEQNISRAITSYNMPAWSNGFFSVNDAGEVVVCIAGQQQALRAIVAAAQEQGLELPILLRFPQILQARLQMLETAFTKAISAHNYGGSYLPVYPIKVNQHRSVVTSLLNNNVNNIGLEAGSKPELLEVLALYAEYNIKNATIICNGYKDKSYLELALLATELGFAVNIIIEKLSELELMLPMLLDAVHKPRLGIRLRLSSIGKGKWQNSGGMKAKFGLTARQTLIALQLLQQHQLSEHFKVLHFHMGSQIADIADIQNGLYEIARCALEFVQHGISIDTIDIGGGLGVDYEGSQSTHYCSMNYSLEEYADTVVQVLANVQQGFAGQPPRIITEAGRALVAHHAVLITNVADVEEKQKFNLANMHAVVTQDTPLILRDLYQCYLDCEQKNILTIIHRVEHLKQAADSGYVHGLLTLEQRAYSEELYLAICSVIQRRLNPSIKTHRDYIETYHENLANQLFCNFSIFQSLPDIWAFKQIFPIMPLSNLDQALDMRAVLCDLTCDSDGKIEAYVAAESLESTLPLPAYTSAQPYLLGFFLVGAYQEILGDMHNLFGDTDTVDVVLNAKGFALQHIQIGDTLATMLAQVDFDPVEVQQVLTTYINQATALGSKRQQQLIAEIAQFLQQKTYLKMA